MSELRDQCRGHWKDILLRLGVPEQCLGRRHGQCPLCNPGSLTGDDRWRFTDYQGNGGGYCSHCGPCGSGVDLLMRFHGWDFKTTAAEIRRAMGWSWTPDASRRQEFTRDERAYMTIFCAIYRDNVRGGVRPTAEEDRKFRAFSAALAKVGERAA